MPDEPTSGPTNDPTDTPTAPVAVPTDPEPAAGTGGPPPWPPATEPIAEPVAEPTTAVPVAGGAEPPKRSGVMVPVWALVTVAGLLIFGLGLLGGWAIASNNDDQDELSSQDLRELIPFDGNGIPGNGQNGDRWENGNGSGNDNDSGSSSSNATVYLGVVPTDSTDPAGAEIEEVADGSPAEEAGLEEGDVITALDGDAVRDAAQLVQRVRAMESGDEVTITYSRDGDSRTVDVTLADRPQMRQLPMPEEAPQSES